MPPSNSSVAEDALALEPLDRAHLARLLIESLEGDRRTDAQIKTELKTRLDSLVAGTDSGLTFEQVFGISKS